MNSPLQFIQFLDEEYKGRFFPYIATDNITEVPFNFHISYFNVIEKFISMSQFQHLDQMIIQLRNIDAYINAVNTGRRKDSKTLVLQLANVGRRYKNYFGTYLSIPQELFINIDRANIVLHQPRLISNREDYNGDDKETNPSLKQIVKFPGSDIKGVNTGIITRNTRLIYFICKANDNRILSGDERDADIFPVNVGLGSEIEQHGLRQGREKILFEIDKKVTFLPSQNSEVDHFYVHELQIIVNTSGVVQGSANYDNSSSASEENPNDLRSAFEANSNNNIVNFERKIYLGYVANIEKIGFIIDSDMPIEFADGRRILYSELKSESNIHIMIFRLQPNTELQLIPDQDSGELVINPEYREDIELLTPIPDFSRKYRIIGTSWVGFSAPEAPIIRLEENPLYQKYLNLFNILMKEYGLSIDLPNIVNFNPLHVRYTYTFEGFHGDLVNITLNHGGINIRNCYEYYKQYIKGNIENVQQNNQQGNIGNQQENGQQDNIDNQQDNIVKYIDQEFINRFLTKEILMRFTPDASLNIKILTEMNWEEIINLRNFNNRVKGITNTKEFVMEYLEKLGYSRDIANDYTKPENPSSFPDSYFHFLDGILYYLRSAKEGKLDTRSLYYNGFINTLRYLIKKTSYMKDKININNGSLSLIIEKGDLDLFKYIFEKQLYTFTEDNNNLEINRILKSILRASNSTDMLDYFISQHHIQLTDSHFYSARGKKMILYLMNKFNLPSDTIVYNVRDLQDLEYMEEYDD